MLQYDGENVIVGFLPIIDDLNRMIDSEDAAHDSLLDGIDLVKNKIGKYFEKLNVEPFGEQGDKMDTDIHDAMLTQSDEKYDGDVILEVFEKQTLQRYGLKMELELLSYCSYYLNQLL